MIFTRWIIFQTLQYKTAYVPYFNHCKKCIYSYLCIINTCDSRKIQWCTHAHTDTHIHPHVHAHKYTCEYKYLYVGTTYESHYMKVYEKLSFSTICGKLLISVTGTASLKYELIQCSKLPFIILIVR